jgi:hypothetical protein
MNVSVSSPAMLEKVPPYCAAWLAEIGQTGIGKPRWI